MKEVDSISCRSSLDTERELSESDRVETSVSGMACKKLNEVAKRPSKKSMKSDLVDPRRTTAQKNKGAFGNKRRVNEHIIRIKR